MAATKRAKKQPQPETYEVEVEDLGDGKYKLTKCKFPDGFFDSENQDDDYWVSKKGTDLYRPGYGNNADEYGYSDGSFYLPLVGRTMTLDKRQAERLDRILDEWAGQRIYVLRSFADGEDAVITPNGLQIGCRTVEPGDMDAAAYAWLELQR